MVQNIPGMLRVLSEGQEMQRRGERLDLNVMVRLGAWTPITESTWESKAGLCREGVLKDAVADVNVGKNKLSLSDWLISHDRRTEMNCALDQALEIYRDCLKDGKLDQEQFAAMTADLCTVYSPKYELRPASQEEAGLFYAMSGEDDEQHGTIGHVRADFGHRGMEFWTTWHPRGPEELNTQEFKDEIDDLVNTLRKNGPLKDFKAMTRYCKEHGGEIEGGICTQNYGYIIETENYRYALRFNPQQGDYNVYLTAFDKRVQEMNMQHAQANEMTMGGM